MATRQRPVFNATFGEFLSKLRQTAGFKSQSQAGLRATQLRLRAVNQQRISLLEKGKTKDPEGAFLRELAQLYRADYDLLIRLLVESKYGVNLSNDLPRHIEDLQQARLSQGESNVGPTSREVTKLHRIIEKYEGRLREMQTVASRLVKLAALGSKKERAATRAESERSTRDRKAG